MLRALVIAAVLPAAFEVSRPVVAAVGETPRAAEAVAVEDSPFADSLREEAPRQELLAGAGGFTHVVPIVLTVHGAGGSFFTSELTLTNRSGVEAEVDLSYTAAIGSGTGTVHDRLAPRGQKTVPDAIAYLRSLGLAIPEGDAGGTLRVTFSGIAAPTDAAASARTTTPVPDGRAGLAYPGVVAGFTNRAYVCGLRQDARDRSNLGLVNLGGPGAGNVTLWVTVYPADRSQGYSKMVSSVTLPPGGFRQLDGVLALAGYSAGWVEVLRMTGSAPFYAYGVVNDQASSDGSFVEPVAESDTVGAETLVLPVVVESGPFTSELILTNTVSYDRDLTLTLVADGIAWGGAVSATLALPGTSQIVVDGVVDWLRQRTNGLPPKGSGVAGALFISGATTYDDPDWVVASGRTSAPGVVGRYGLFYAAVADGHALDDAAWIYGLRQDAENRTNLAIVNTGETSPTSSDSFAIDVYDGATGSLAGTISPVVVGPRGWVQLPMVLTKLPSPPSNAFAKVRRTSGTNPFLAYAVINDGAGPGQRSGDGAFLAARPDCVYTSPAAPVVPGRTGGTFSTSVVLAPGCPWTATTTEPWISFPEYGHTAGTGNASVSFVVAKNEAATTRTGAVWIGGARVEVLQGANAVSAYDGTWSGSTGEGRPFSFKVAMGEIVSLTLGISISLSCGSAIATYSQNLTTPAGIYEARLGFTTSLSSTGTGSPNTTVSGAFPTSGSASGTFSVSSIRTGSTTCIILGNKPGSTWSATKQ